MADVADLVVVAGQSNAVGYDAPPGRLSPDEVDKHIRFWWRCGDPPPDAHDSTSGGRWSTLRAQPRGNPLPVGQDRQYGNFNQPEGGFGPEISLGRTLYRRERRPLAIVKAAWSGTGMRRDWNTQGPGGECFRGLIAELAEARRAATTEGFSLRPRALVWVQGESDANVEDAADYSQALETMLEGLRTALAAPQLLALVGLNTRFGAEPGAPELPLIRTVAAAQQALATRDPRCVYVETVGATLANTAHFDAAGTLEIGRRFAEALLERGGQ